VLLLEGGRAYLLRSAAPGLQEGEDGCVAPDGEFVDQERIQA
jgi:hypothetical protein